MLSYVVDKLYAEAKMSEPSPLKAILTRRDFPKAKPLSTEAQGSANSSAKPVDLIKYEKNLEDLRNTLGQIDSLLAGKQTPEIAAKCASLLGYVAAIDLPAEIKNQEAGRYPPQVQEQVAKTLDSQNKNTDGQSAQAAAQSAAIMQRMSEEAQTRIQKEAALRVETSQLETVKVLHEMDERQEKAINDFLNSEYSEENERRARLEIEQTNTEKIAQSKKNQEKLLKNIPNMSLEDLQKAIEKENRIVEEQRRIRAGHLRQEQIYLQEAAKHPKNSDEYKKYMGLAEFHARAAMGAEVVARNSAANVVACNDQKQALRKGLDQMKASSGQSKTPSSSKTESENNGAGSKKEQQENRKEKTENLAASFVPQTQQQQEDNPQEQSGKDNKDQTVAENSSSLSNTENLDGHISDTMSIANQVVFNDEQPATKEKAPNLPGKSGSSMNSTLMEAGSIVKVKDIPDKSEDNSLLNGFAMENSTVSGLG